MPAEPLLDAYAKTEWAEAEIHKLDISVQDFFQSNPYESRSTLNSAGTERVWRFALTKRLPRSFSVAAGAILHALRTPLDQMVSAVMESLGQSQTGVSFVFGDKSDKFEAGVRAMKKLAPELRELMREAQPYPGGNNALWALHKLNRGDKHRKGLVPLIMPAETRMSYLRFDYGLPIHVGCRTGKHLSLADMSLVSGHAIIRSPTAHYEAGPGNAIQFGDAGTPGDESLEFMTTTPSAQFQTDFKPALEVGFDESAVRGQPVTAVLNEMRHAVESVLLAFEKRFF